MKRIAITVFLITAIVNLAFSQKDSLLYKNKEDLMIYTFKVLYKEKEIYNSESESTEFIKKEKIDGCKVIADIYINPLSLIDHYYSYEYFFGSEFACGRYRNDIKVETINLQTLEKVSLSDLFTEEPIVNALKNDDWVLKIVKELSLENKLDSVNPFNEILQLLNDLEYGVQFYTSSFTIVDNTIKDSKIGVRLVGSQPLSVSYHLRHLQLGLMLVPKQDFKKVLPAKTKFVLGEFKNGLIN